MAIEIKELTIKMNVEETRNDDQNNDSSAIAQHLEQLKEDIISEAVERIMEQLRLNIER